jgi:formylglycine-generating enzyme required for sulfatase activity/serine/threonine protein kinase
MMKASNHPSHQHCFDRLTLSAFLLGQLPAPELERIAAEVETCAACQAALETMDGLDDSVVRDLRVASSADVSQLMADLESSLCQAEEISREIWREQPAAGFQPGAAGGGQASPPPHQIGQYELLGQIGRGGMGTVYKAFHSRLKRHVALKLLSSERTREPQAVARFLREMEAVGRLDHPNLVRAYDAGESDGRHFLVMEMVEGIELSRLVRLFGHLSIADACEAIRQAASGLQYVHEHGLVHRDVKPSNLMLTFDGRIKVLDLGLARLTTVPAGEVTGSGQIIGTGDYIAPEQARSTRSADARSDIYSLGCTLYHLLAGHAPFADRKHNTFLSKVLAHARQPVPSIRQFCDQVPDGLVGVLERMLAKERDHRYQSAGEVAESLQAWCEVADLKQLALKAQTAQPVSSSQVESPLAAETDPESTGSSRADVPLELLSEPPTAKKPFQSHQVAVQRPSDSEAGENCETGSKTQSPMGRRWAAASCAVAMVFLLVLEIMWSRNPGDHRSEGRVASQRPAAGASDHARRSVGPPLAVAPFDAAEAGEHQRRWAEHQKMPMKMTNSIGMELVLIPPGEFEMGSSQEEIDQYAKEAQADHYEPWYLARLPSEGPRHLVRVGSPFFLAQRETTVGQFRRFVEETGYQTDAEKDGQGAEGPDLSSLHWSQKPQFTWRDPGFSQNDDHPVAAVSWQDALEFCRWLSHKEGKNYRLPTEAEWEYACRAGTTTRYWFGDDVKMLHQAENVADTTLKEKFPSWAPSSSISDGHPFTAPSGRFWANPFGLYDMHGNVAEWCADWYGDASYRNAPVDNPTGPATGEYRVVRGSHWGRKDYAARSASRSWGEPYGRTAAIGFRVAL